MTATQRSVLCLACTLLDVSVVQAGTVREDYAAAHARWLAAEPQAYHYSVESSQTVYTSCRENRPARLSVRAGKVRAGVYLDEQGQPQKAIAKSCLRFFYTVNAAFGYIRDNVTHRLTVSYDPTLGFPTSLVDRDILDGDFPLKIWNLTPDR